MINVQHGASQLFHSVRDHVRQAFKLRIPELSPASDEADELIRQSARQLRDLLSIPDTHDIFFLPETGTFLDEAMRTAGDRHTFSPAHDLLFKYPAIASGNAADADTRLLVLQHTDEAGTALSPDLLANLRSRFSHALVAVDVRLAWPYASLPFDMIDAILLDFHFGFGMPAGLSAGIVNDRWIQRHPLPRRSYETIHPSLNLTWVSVLGGVTGDMLSRGIATIRRETEYKSSLLYHVLDQHPVLQPAVADTSRRSRTVIAAQGPDISRVEAELRRHAISAGSGAHSLVFANFPSHSKEQYERLADILTAVR